MKKYYTVSEANAMIPALKPKVVKLMKLNSAIDLLDSIEIQYDDEYETIKKDIMMNRKFHSYSVRFCKELENFLEKGILVRDLTEGVVNFYSKKGAKDIFLCWKLSDDKVSHWYETDSDYEARKPISELKPKNKLN